MLAKLRELRAEIDQALPLLERLQPAVAAWQAGQEPARAEAAPAGSSPVANGSSPPDPSTGEPSEVAPQDPVPAPAVAEPAPASTATPQQPCPGCNTLFTPKNWRQKFCTRPCGQRVWAAARKASPGAPRRARRRRGTPVPPEPEAPADALPSPERQASENGLAANGQDGPQCQVCGASIDAGAEVCSDACGAVLRKIHPPLPAEPRP
jgi:hypothetical protein